MRLPTKSSAWGKTDSRLRRRHCDGCGITVGVGVPHAGGCPIKYPGSPPGVFYLPAQAAQMCGMSRQALGPATERHRLGVRRDDDPPFVEIGGKLWIEKDALAKWLALHRPKWLARMQDTRAGKHACLHCKKTRGHEPTCPGKITLARLHEIRKLPGRCGSCGHRLGAPDFGFKTCRKCRTADRMRNGLRKKALNGQIQA